MKSYVLYLILQTEPVLKFCEILAIMKENSNFYLPRKLWLYCGYLGFATSLCYWKAFCITFITCCSQLYYRCEVPL